MKQVAADLGLNENRLYAWRKKFTADGEKTRYSTLEDEVKALKLEVVELKME